MPGLHSRPVPLDQAHGLRRLFAHARVRFVPVASNPHVAFGGVMLERLCTALGEHGKHTLVVDAAERSREAAGTWLRSYQDEFSLRTTAERALVLARKDIALLALDVDRARLSRDAASIENAARTCAIGSCKLLPRPT